MRGKGLRAACEIPTIAAKLRRRGSSNSPGPNARWKEPRDVSGRNQISRRDLPCLHVGGSAKRWVQGAGHRRRGVGLFAEGSPLAKGLARADTCVGHEPNDPTSLKVFQYCSQLRRSGYVPVAGSPAVYRRWADFRELYGA